MNAKIHEIKLVDFWQFYNQQSMISCIYCIKNLQSGKKYIGSCKKLRNRIHLHIRTLKHQNHHSRILQRAFNKYGIENFCVEILEVVNEIKDLLNREQYYLDFYNPEYNIAKVAGSSLGIKRTDEFKEKIRKAISGVKHPQWRKDLKSKYQLGKKHKKFSEEGQKNCSEAQKLLYKTGRRISPLKGRIPSNKEMLNNRLKNFKPIIQLTINNEFVKRWDSAIIVKETLGFHASNIVACCTGRKNKAYGYKWKHA